MSLSLIELRAMNFHYCEVNRGDKRIANETLIDLGKLGGLCSTIGHFDTTSTQDDKSQLFLSRQ